MAPEIETMHRELPPGPWNTEPKQGGFEHRGLKCRIARHESLGNLCGYVAVEPGHPRFENCSLECEDIDVHGDVTYARLEKDGRFWIGFDCAHGCDLIPAYPIQGLPYRDWNYVEAECRKLAEQLAAMMG